MSASPLRETCLADVHRAHGARMVEFGGWNMPVQYTSLLEEHLRTRSSCSLFDVSHMGRVKVFGPDAERAVERLCPVKITDAMVPGQSRYSFLLDSEGGTIDDLLVTRDLDGVGLVINASNREADLAWMKEQTADLDIRFLDMTDETCMIAVQGPKAVAILAQLTSENVSDLPYYHAMVGVVAGQLGVISRTGYTGEDGFEVTVPASAGPDLWRRLLAVGGDAIGPAGLGARDTLRLEAAMPLHGHELSRSISPLEAGLTRFVELANETFIGRAPTVALQERKPTRKSVCLRGEGRKVPREGAVLSMGGRPVGAVTSGTFSPTYECPIAMGFVETALKIGDRLEADVRGKSVAMEIVKRPFYKRQP